MSTHGLADLYAFEDVLVDTRAHRVTKAGTELPLEPKAYEVLLELLRQPGVALSRDALLDAVWGHRHVTPAVLNRVIAMLRRALGDDADHPHLIRTVHGTGYAFIGEVTSKAESPNAPPAPPALRDEPEPVVVAQASPVTGRMRFASLMLGVVAIAVAATWTIANRNPVEAPAAPAPRDAPPRDDATTPAPAAASLALLPPEFDAKDTELRALSFAYVDGLRDALARLPGVSVAGSESARVAVLRAQQPAKAGTLLGVEHVLEPAISREGDAIVLELKLIRVADARELWRRRFVESRDVLFRTIGPVLDGVAEHIESERVVDPVLAAPPSAQDLYWRGMVEGQIGTPTRARAYFEQALEIEPRFPIAYVAIARTWRDQALRRELPLDEAAAKGRVAVSRALEIDPNFVPAHVFEALLLTMQWRAAEAEVPVRRARAIEPDNVGVLALTANLAGYAGRPNEALALRPRVAAMDPFSTASYTLWARDLAMAGDLDGAIAKIREAQSIAPASTFASDNETRLLASYGRFDEALANDARSPPGDIHARLAVATMHTTLGEHDRAEAIIAELGDGGIEPPGFAQTVLSLHWSRGEFDRAVAWIDGEGRARVQDPWRSVLRARALALAGRRDESLEAYRSVFGDPGNRDLLSSSVFALHTGISDLANWAALEREAGAGDEQVADFERRLAIMVEGGFAFPVVEYYRAVAALLHDDVAAADAALGRALARGWRDRIALESDLAWRAHAQADWLVRHRATLQSSLDAMRQADTPP